MKTYQNAPNFQIDPKHELGLFLGNFWIYGEIKKSRWIRGNQRLLIPYVMGKPNGGGPIFMDLGAWGIRKGSGSDEHEEHVEGTHAHDR